MEEMTEVASGLEFPEGPIAMTGSRIISQRPLDTAHRLWDDWWADDGLRSGWSDAEPAVLATVEALRARDARRVLDVGAGVGRHALAFARSGFEVFAVDASPTGLGVLTGVAAADRLTVGCAISAFRSLPFADAGVDHIVAWNVLYHGDGSIVRDAFRECRRVLREGGTFALTMLSTRHRAYGIGDEVRLDTFVDAASGDDKAHPHYYVDGDALTALLESAGFVVVTMDDVDQEPPGGFHWTVLAEVAPGPTGPGGRGPH